MIEEIETKKRRIYSPKKINELYNSIEEHLTYREQEIVKEIIGDFNDLVAYARETKKYIEYKKNDWLKAMNENHKLEQENRDLKEKIEHLKKTIINLKETFKK